GDANNSSWRIRPNQPLFERRKDADRLNVPHGRKLQRPAVLRPQLSANRIATGRRVAKTKKAIHGIVALCWHQDLLFLAFVVIVTRHMMLNNVGRDAMV